MIACKLFDFLHPTPKIYHMYSDIITPLIHGSIPDDKWINL